MRCIRKMIVGRLALACLVTCVCIGCSGEPEPVDTPQARKAAQAAPKSTSELPASMPPEAKAGAAAAMGQAKVIQDQNSDPARVHAMQMMRQQHGQ